MGYDTELKYENSLKCGCIESKYRKSHDFFNDTSYYTVLSECFKHKNNYAFVNESDDESDNESDNESDDESDDEPDDDELNNNEVNDDELNNDKAIKVDFQITKVYLYVPFEYKNDAKKFGAKFDFDKKKWYVYSNSIHKQFLIDIFNDNNFTTSYHGTKMKAMIHEQFNNYNFL